MFDRVSGRRVSVAVSVCLGLVLGLSACPELAARQAPARGAQPPAPAKPPAVPRPATPEPTPAAPATPAPPAVQIPASELGDLDRAAIPALVQAYFDALNQRDLEGALGFWSPQADTLPTMRRSLPRIFEINNPVWSEVALTDLKPVHQLASARVAYLVTSRRGTGSHADPGTRTRSVMGFVREAGGWRIISEKPESQEIAERLVTAEDDGGVSLVLAEEKERMSLAVVRGIIGLAGEAGSRSAFPRAIRAYELAIRLAESPETTLTPYEQQHQQADMHLATALTGLAQAYAYKPQPDVPRAMELFNRALAIHERTANESGQSDVQQALGNVYYGSGDYAAALDRYQRALPLAEKQQDWAGTARTQLGIGNVQYLFGQYDLALAAYTVALDLYVRSSNQQDQPRALQGMARVYAGMGDYARAREQYARALEMLRPTRQQSDQASVLIEIARICFLQGQLAEARTNYDEARTVATQASDLFNLGRVDYGAGLLHVVQGEYDKAIERYTAAQRSFEAARNADGAGQALLARASARVEQRDLPGALQDFTTSLRAFEATKNREGASRAHLGLAGTYVLRREAKAALDAAGRAGTLAAQVIVPDVQWQARLEAGRAWRLAGDEAKARTAFEEAIALLESTRLEAGGDAEAQTPTQRAAPYVALAEWHVTRNDAARALIAADAAKRRNLEDLLRPFSFRLTRGLTPERQAEERRIASRRVSLLKQIRRERDLAKPDATRLAALEKDLAAARADAAAWQAAVTREAPTVAWQRGEATFTSLEPLAAALDSTTALIHFVVGDERTTAIVATKPAGQAGQAEQPGLDVFAFTVAATRQQLAEQVWKFTDGIATRADTVNAGARALYDMLLAPARERLAGRVQLVIVPDDSLWTLPFEALMPDDMHYLIQDAAITALPSVAAWLSRPPGPAGAPLTAWPATGEFSDVSPLQTLLTLPAAESADPSPETPAPSAPSVSPAAAPAAPTSSDTPGAPTTLAAWELFARDLATDVAVLAGVTPKAERLRLDSGRLGATGLWWGLQLAGAPRAMLARRPIPPDLPTPTALPLPHPHDWAIWLAIGPPMTGNPGS